MKKLIASAIVALEFVAGVASADESVVVGGVEWYYEINGGQAKITRVDAGAAEVLTVPAEIGGCPVAEIGFLSFSDCSFLKEVAITDTVKVVGESAFYGCASLQTVYGGESVEEIGRDAFYDCSSLKDIRLGARVTDIGIAAFYNCSSLEKIEIPGHVHTIGSWAFCGCDKLKRVSLGEGVSAIADYAFEGCAGLERLYVPANIKSIGESAFSGCSSLSEVVMADGVLAICREAFSGCASLERVVLGGSLKSIGVGAFNECGALTSLTIPSGVSEIGYLAFWDCSALKQAVFFGDAPEGLEDSLIFESLEDIYYPHTCADSYREIVPENVRSHNAVLAFPELREESEITDVLAGMVDRKVIGNVKTMGQYESFRAWFSGLDEVSAEAVKLSDRAWLSYALDSDRLVATELKTEDISVASFMKSQTSENGYSLAFAVAGIEIGENADAENLKGIFVVEGAMELGSGANWDAQSVDIASIKSSFGGIEVNVQAKNKEAKSFFFRVRLFE